MADEPKGAAGTSPIAPAKPAETPSAPTPMPPPKPPVAPVTPEAVVETTPVNTNDPKLGNATVAEAAPKNLEIGNRIKIKEDVTPGMPISGPNGSILGEYVPGLGYAVTPENHASCQDMVDRGFATQVDPGSAPFSGGPTDLSAADAKTTGTIDTGKPAVTAAEASGVEKPKE